MTKVRVILDVDEDTLRGVYEGNCPDDEYSLESALSFEMGWVRESGVYLNDIEEFIE